MASSAACGTSGQCSQCAAAAPQGAAGIAAADMPWQDFVQDARLREIVEPTLQNNREFTHSRKNIELAQAQYRINRADLSHAWRERKRPAHVAFNSSRSAAAGGPSVATSYAAGFGINSGKIDLFGRIRSMSTTAPAPNTWLPKKRAKQPKSA